MHRIISYGGIVSPRNRRGPPPSGCVSILCVYHVITISKKSRTQKEFALMKMMAVLRNSAGRIRTLLRERSATDYLACRTSGILLLLLTATVVLPPVLVQIAIGRRGVFYDLWLVLVMRISGPDAGWSGMASGFAFPAIVFLFLVGVFGFFSGVTMLRLARKLRNSPLSKSHTRQRCGYLLLGLIFFVCAILHPWFLFSLFVTEKYIIVPHAIAVLTVGYVTSVVAIGMLSRGDGNEPSVLALRLHAVDCNSKASINRWINTDAKAYRICGMVSFLFVAILVLPVVWFQVTSVFCHAKMTTVVDVWLTGGSEANSIAVIPTLLTLAITIGGAMFAFVVGVRMFAHAKRSQGKVNFDIQVCLQCRRLLQRFVWLLLVIIPGVTVFTFRSGYSNAKQINLSRLFETVDFSLWREARATFLWMQFLPLLLLGCAALFFAYGCRSNIESEE